MDVIVPQSSDPSLPLPEPVVMPSTNTNILALPLVTAEIITGNNEDWVDTIQYLVDNGTGDTGTFPQLDLRGIDFVLEVRHALGDHEVVIQASTFDGTMAVGAPPNYGFLIIYVPLDSVMKYKEAGNYVADIVAMDGKFTITAVQIDLTIFEGVTR